MSPNDIVSFLSSTLQTIFSVHLGILQGAGFVNTPERLNIFKFNGDVDDGDNKYEGDNDDDDDDDPLGKTPSNSKFIRSVI